MLDKEIATIKDYGSIDLLRKRFLCDYKILSIDKRKARVEQYEEDIERIDRMITNVELARNNNTINDKSADDYHFLLFEYWRYFRSAIILMNDSIYKTGFHNRFTNKQAIPRDIIEAKMFIYNVSSPQEAIEYENTMKKRKMEDGLNSEERCLYLYGAFDSSNVVPLVQEINRINSLDSEMKLDTCSRLPIVLRICSKGGNAEDMWFLIDSIKQSKTPIYTYCSGYARNEAFLVFLMGEERYMSQHASIGCDMRFYDSHCAGDNYHEVQEIENIIITRTKLDIRSFDGDIDIRGNYYPDKIAVGKGVVNAII